MCTGTPRRTLTTRSDAVSVEASDDALRRLLEKQSEIGSRAKNFDGEPTKCMEKYTCFKESSCLLKTSKSIISKCDIFKFINFQEHSFSCQNEWWIIANFLEKVTTSLPWSDPSDSSCYSQNGMPSGGSGWRQSGQIRHHSTINPKSFHRGNYTCPPQSSNFSVVLCWLSSL